MAEYTMEDTQNSAPGEPTAHEASKLSAAPRRPDAQSVTKRYATPAASLHGLYAPSRNQFC